MKVWKTFKILGLKMKFYLIMFLMLVLCVSCSHLPEQETLFGEVLSEFAAQMFQEEDMFAFGTGGAMSGGGEKNLISKFFFSFESKKCVNLEQARSLALRCIGKFLDKINRNEEIRQYLEYYPYRTRGITFIFGFYPHEKGNPTSVDQCVHTVFFVNDELEYRKYDLLLKKDVKIFEETYEEALERDAQIRQGQQ